MTLSHLKPGRRFTVKYAPKLKGKLISLGICSASVKYDDQPKPLPISLETEIEEGRC